MSTSSNDAHTSVQVAGKVLRANGVPAQNPDYTSVAVRKQLEGMYCDRYEIGILSRDGTMTSRRGRAAEVINLILWLKKKNRNGASILIRPDEGDMNAGLVLVDDLSFESLVLMSEDGIKPASVVETSPGRYQAWIRIAGYSAEVAPELATACAKYFATEYSGDSEAADWQQYGHLVGFKNHMQPSENGVVPDVLFRGATKEISKPASEVLFHFELAANPLLARFAADA